MGKKIAPELGGAGAEDNIKDTTASANAQANDLDEQEEPQEPSFEEKVFERMRKESADFAQAMTRPDWDKVYDEYQQNIMTDRARAWTFILYPDPGVVERFWEVVTSLSLQGCVSPLHDRDKWPDGKQKAAHYHVFLYFPGKTSAQRVRDILDTFNGKMLQPVANITGLVRYFAHLDIDPKKRPGDRGKVHYCVDDIVSFGGFDHLMHVKATDAQKYRAAVELRAIVRDRDITAYCDLLDLIDDELVAYQYIIIDRRIAADLVEFIHSRYAKTHAGQERRLMAHRLAAQDRQVAEMRGMLADATAQVDRLARFMTGEME